jgi:hypothetical protein
VRVSPSPTLESVDETLKDLLAERHDAAETLDIKRVVDLSKAIDQYLQIRSDLMRAEKEAA